MGKVIYDMSMSLDGFITAAGKTSDEPLGIGGERLHEWALQETDPRGQALLDQSIEEEGAIIVGRRTYDESLRWWGQNGPVGERRTPVFVLTHRPSPPPDPGSVYTFVTDVDQLIEQARAAAEGKNIGVSGGEVAHHLLRAGHVDEISLHVVPVLFGDGMQISGLVGDEHVHLDLVETVPTPDVVHLRYRVPQEGRLKPWESSSCTTPSPSTAPSNRRPRTRGWSWTMTAGTQGSTNYC